jgi:RNA polymerase sigma-70 factor (ECF subfamily)
MKPNLPSIRSSTISDLSENDAVRLAQEGESKGFERLYQLHCQRVYSLCLRLVKDPIEAEDLTQDAFLQTFRKIQTFRGDSLFSTWLHRLTVNIALMSFRKKKHFEIPLDDTLESDEESRRPYVEFSVPDLNLNGVIDRINLQNVINQLPRGSKKMLVLHDSKGYEHHEISQILGCSVENSKSQLRRARMRLRELLPKHLPTRANNDAPFARISTESNNCGSWKFF